MSFSQENPDSPHVAALPDVGYTLSQNMSDGTRSHRDIPRRHLVERHIPESHLIGVDEALETVLSGVEPLPAEEVPLIEAFGRVLAEPVIAGEDIPPFANSAMDGYAVRTEDVTSASKDSPVVLKVIGSSAAGHVPSVTVTPGTAVRVMTGAPMPDGADAVVRFENTDEPERGIVGVPKQVKVYAPARVWDNVRQAGEDVQKGQVVLEVGKPIRAGEVGLLAATGHTTVRVHRRPRVAILSTGDELVPPGDPLVPGKIRDANGYSLYVLVKKYGGVPVPLGIARDTEEELRAKLHEGLERGVDLFLTSAGVSKGDYDVVKSVLDEEGEISFWMVRMKPGQPLAFGHIHGVPLLGLPGNPVSSIVSFEEFGRPMLLKMQGHTYLRKPTVEAIAADSFKNSGRRNHVRVRVVKRGNCYVAHRAGPQGSGILLTLSRANGLMIIPEGVYRVEPGEKVEVQMLDWPEVVESEVLDVEKT